MTDSRPVAMVTPLRPSQHPLQINTQGLLSVQGYQIHPKIYLDNGNDNDCVASYFDSITHIEARVDMTTCMLPYKYGFVPNHLYIIKYYKMILFRIEKKHL